MRVLIVALLLCGSAFVAKAQSKNTDPLEVKLASRILLQTPQFVYGGDRGQPIEVMAFNLIYNLPDAEKRFKAIYARSNTAGKLYCVIGLFCLKDKEYERYKASFVAINDTSKVDIQFGCFPGREDKNELLEKWLKAYADGIWYTKIVLKNSAFYF